MIVRRKFLSLVGLGSIAVLAKPSPATSLATTSPPEDVLTEAARRMKRCMQLRKTIDDLRKQSDDIYEAWLNGEMSDLEAKERRRANWIEQHKWENEIASLQRMPMPEAETCKCNVRSTDGTVTELT